MQSRLLAVQTELSSAAQAHRERVASLEAALGTSQRQATDAAQEVALYQSQVALYKDKLAAQENRTEQCQADHERDATQRKEEAQALQDKLAASEQRHNDLLTTHAAQRSELDEAQQALKGVQASLRNMEQAHAALAEESAILSRRLALAEADAAARAEEAVQARQEATQANTQLGELQTACQLLQAQLLDAAAEVAQRKTEPVLATIVPTPSPPRDAGEKASLDALALAVMGMSALRAEAQLLLERYKHRSPSKKISLLSALLLKNCPSTPPEAAKAAAGAIVHSPAGAVLASMERVSANVAVASPSLSTAEAAAALASASAESKDLVSPLPRRTAGSRRRSGNATPGLHQTPRLQRSTSMTTRSTLSPPNSALAPHRLPSSFRGTHGCALGEQQFTLHYQVDMVRTVGGVPRCVPADLTHEMQHAVIDCTRNLIKETLNAQQQQQQ